MGRTLIIIGKTWLWVAGAFIVLGHLSIIYFDGLGKFWETVSPFNIANWLVVLLALLPGILLSKLGKRLQDPAVSDSS